MTYDGRFRLGCEGILYILIEQFSPEEAFFAALEKELQQRSPFKIECYYSKTVGEIEGIGSKVYFADKAYNLSVPTKSEKELSKFSETLQPCFKLMIFGAEHDAVQLCKLAHYNGWEVTVVSGPLESKSITDFPGATAFFSVSPDALELDSIDHETAIVVMSHNYANDLKYLIEIKDTKPAYIGLLGPKKRREKLLSQFIEYCPDVHESFLENLYGPTGLNIGAETPQEIAISIVSEILSVIRNHKPVSLKEKWGRIHSKT
jgi:xanthine/CO dehydrogenase XdhC/CoxF family maturation factor